MAKKTILVCDMCGAEVEEQKGATMRVTYTDARRGSRAGGSLRQLCRQAARPHSRASRPQAEGRRVVRRGSIRRHPPALDWVVCR